MTLPLSCSIGRGKVISSTLGQTEHVVRVAGYANSSPGFAEQGKVMNGPFDLLGQISGEKGCHARTSVGVSDLPLNIAVEVELVLAYRS